jgi:hypothetical protein
MARGRPPKEGLWAEKNRIRVKVWEALKSQGHTLPIELVDGKSRLIRGHHSVKVAVAAVAEELKFSTTTVWNAWSGFDPLSYVYGQEKFQSDYEWDIHYQCRHDEALASLQREFGNRADFSNEEIEARAEDLDEGRCYPDD